MIHFEMLTGTHYDSLGYIPRFLISDDPRPARVQFDQSYLGGWHKMEGFTLNLRTMSLKYPGDPSLLALAKADLGQEIIIVYPHAWVLILQPDGSFEVARLD